MYIYKEDRVNVKDLLLFLLQNDNYSLLVFSLKDFRLSIFLIISAAFSAIIIVAAFGFPEIALRMTDASTMRRFSIPRTLKGVQMLNL